MQEDAKLAQAERQGLRHRRAEAQRGSEQQHMSGQCVRLLQEFEELQAAVADLREAAASACLPLSEAERDALGTALAALPLHQLEGAVAIALARSPGLRDAAHEVGGACGACSLLVMDACVLVAAGWCGAAELLPLFCS